MRRWLDQEFPRILAEAQERDAHLVFLDESGFMLTPVVRRTLWPRGVTPVLPVAAKHDRISAISCITLSPKLYLPGLYALWFRNSLEESGTSDASAPQQLGEPAFPLAEAAE